LVRAFQIYFFFVINFDVSLSDFWRSNYLNLASEVPT